MLTFISNVVPVSKKKYNINEVDTSEFEPWRLRLAEAVHKAVHETDFEMGSAAESLELSRSYFNRLVKKGVAKPNPNEFIAICEILGLHPGWVISGDHPAAKKDRIARRVLEASDDDLERVEQIFDIAGLDRVDPIQK